MRKEILLTAFAALLMQPLVAQEKKSPSFDEVLTTRRSIRSYDATKKISEQEVRTLMEAVQEAPSWANQQPSKYYVAMTPEKLTAVQELIGGNKRNVQGAPVLIVSTFERGKSGFFQGNPANEVGDGWGAYDNGLSNCYLIMQARAWVSTRSSWVCAMPTSSALFLTSRKTRLSWPSSPLVIARINPYCPVISSWTMS